MSRYWAKVKINMFYCITVPGVPGRISSRNDKYEKVRKLNEPRKKRADFCVKPQEGFGKEVVDTSRTGGRAGMVSRAKGRCVLAMMGQSEIYSLDNKNLKQFSRGVMFLESSPP